jgi:hypothetical protein
MRTPRQSGTAFRRSRACVLRVLMAFRASLTTTADESLLPSTNPTTAVRQDCRFPVLHRYECHQLWPQLSALICSARCLTLMFNKGAYANRGAETAED